MQRSIRYSSYLLMAALFLVMELFAVCSCALLHFFFGWFPGDSGTWRQIAGFQVWSLLVALTTALFVYLLRKFCRPLIDQARYDITALWNTQATRLSWRFFLKNSRPSYMLLVTIAVFLDVQRFAPPEMNLLGAELIALIFSVLLVPIEFVAYQQGEDLISRYRAARALPNYRE